VNITVLGTGCYKCIALESTLAEILAELSRSDVVLERVDDENVIRRFMPLDAIPGFVIDGRLVCSGEVPTRETLRQWLGESHSEATRSEAC